MISKITASFAFTGLLFFSSPVLAENHAHEDVHQEESHAETHNEAVEAHGQEHTDSHGEDADGQDIKAVVKETIAHKNPMGMQAWIMNSRKPIFNYSYKS